MFSEATFVFILIVVAAALMTSNRVRFDIVALLVVIALMLSGVLSVSESLAGFGSPVVILVVGLLIVGEMLARTGVARAVGNAILKHGGGDETRLLVLIMVRAAVLGSVMSSTAVVAIFIPIILRIARQTRLGASRLLLPMSYAALISGMLPLADALNATGGTRMIIDALLALVGEGSPYLMLTVIFWLTAPLGLVLSNTASAVLVAPIAVYGAAALGVSPDAFGVAVLIAASAAYSTPVSTPVVTLVVEPGWYRFGDFLKIGVPLLFLTYLTTLALAPAVFPFQ